MLCTICEVNEVKNEGQECCVICHFSGRKFESYLLDDDRANVLGRIRELPHVTEARVWHLGVGQFQLGVMLDDGRLVIPGVAIEVEGQTIVGPAVPPMDASWAVAVTDEEQEEIATMEGAYTDEELIQVVGALSEGLKPDNLPVI